MSVENFVGHDANKRVRPTAEKQAEIDAELDAGGMFEVDLSTLEGAAKSVRPAATMFTIHAVILAIWATLLSLGNGDPDLALALWLSVPVASALAIFIFLKSRIAVLLGVAYLGLLWFEKVLAVINGELSGLLGGLIFIVILTVTMFMAIPGSFAFHRLKAAGGTNPAQPSSDTVTEAPSDLSAEHHRANQRCPDDVAGVDDKRAADV
jgi:hypothetical protein